MRAAAVLAGTSLIMAAGHQAALADEPAGPEPVGGLSAEQAAMPAAPALATYDAAAGAMGGTAQPGLVVRALGPGGETLAEALVDQDGGFTVALPQGTDPSGVSLVAIDPLTGATSATLGAEEVAAAVAAYQEGLVRSVVAASTSDLASGIASSLAGSGVGEPGDDGSGASMPVVPYVLGAASALIAVGGVGAAVYAGGRARRRDGGGLQEDAAREEPAMFVDDEDGWTGWSGSDGEDAAPRPRGSHFAPEPEGHLETDGADAVAPGAPEDEVELAAMAFVAGQAGGEAPEDDGPSLQPAAQASPGAAVSGKGSDVQGQRAEVAAVGAVGPDDTIPCAAALPPIDPARFAEVARLLATGTGAVHRVVAPTLEVDMSGLERMGSQGEHAAWSREEQPDPFSDGQDWREVALRELGHGSGGDGDAFTERTAPRTSEQPQGPAADPLFRTAYVAPVVGPASVTRAEAERRWSPLTRAQSLQASALIRREEEPRGHKLRLSREEREQEGVPQIARGAAAQAPTLGPAADGGQLWGPGGAFAARGPVVPEIDAPGRPWLPAPVGTGLSAPGPFGASARPQVREDPAVVSSAVAAAYAAAVYGDVHAAPAAASAARPLRLSSVPEVAGEDAGAAQGSGWAAMEEEATRPFTPAYIDYLVQEEFEHRHDTIAQRNAALGRLHVVNGAAQPPVSVRDGLALHRYMA